MSKPSRRRRTGRVVLPDEGVSVSLLAAARVTAEAGLPVTLTQRTFLGLVRELGGGRQAWQFIRRLAEETRRPVFTNCPRSDRSGGSATVAIAPADWTQERLAGFTAGYRDELVELFGAVDGPPQSPRNAP